MLEESTQQEDQIAIERLRHSAAHVVAQATLRISPDAKLGIGPATEDGFYYDIEFPEIKDQTKFLKQLYAEIEDIIESEMPFTQIFLNRDEAYNMLFQRGQIYKTELLQAVNEEEVSFYKTGDEFLDLCRGPHVDHTGKIGSIKITNIEKVHWLNDDDRPEMYRISGQAFFTKGELKDFEQEQRQLKARDHRKTGEQYNIFLNKPNKDKILLERGIALRDVLLHDITAELSADKYRRIQFNQILEKNVFEKNESRLYYRQPDYLLLNESYYYINRPLDESIHNISSQIKYAQKTELPIVAKNFSRITKLDAANNTIEENDSDSEEKQINQGLYDTLMKTQIVGYLAADKSELRKELRQTLSLITGFYKKLFGNNLYFQVSIKENHAFEDELMELLVEFNMNIKKNTLGNAGESDPIISIYYKDIFAKNWELAKFELLQGVSNHLTTDLTSRSRPINISFWQITFITSIEMLLALLTEKYDGNFPLQIAPYQAVILPKASEFNDYCRNLYKQLIEKGLRVQLDTDASKYEQKLKNAQEMNYPYILIVGEQEMKNKVFFVKPGVGDDLGLMSAEEFLQKVMELR